MSYHAIALASLREGCLAVAALRKRGAATALSASVCNTNLEPYNLVVSPKGGFSISLEKVF